MISPGTVLVIPGRQRPLIYVNGFIYMLGEQAAPIVSENAEYLTYMSPFAYLIKEDGTLQPIPDGPALQAALSHKVAPMMAITNFTATARGENLASVVLNDPNIINRLLTEILRIMNEKGYRGLNVDFENVLPADREAYNRFLQLTVNRLHPEGYFVSTSLAPKEGPQQAGLLYEAHDYPAHGRIADFVVLMTYEWGYRKGPPRAISPLNLIRRVLDYAVTVIPREKIFFGFQIYARDWVLPHVAGQEAETFSCQEAVSRAVRFGASIQYDPVAQSPFFRYTDQSGRGHEVWFEDARSAQAKFDTVKNYRLAGISYWALGYPFPQNWALLGDNFTIRKEG
jgi:spore germination protein